MLKRAKMRLQHDNSNEKQRGACGKWKRVYLVGSMDERTDKLNLHSPPKLSRAVLNTRHENQPLFFSHYAGNHYFNMAFDEWMYRAVCDTSGLLILRLYTWEVGTITFGYNQRESTAYDNARVGDTPVIRRVTGGRAVYHDLSEITYSVAVNTSDEPGKRVGNTVSTSSAAIATALARFLQRVGHQADYARRSSPENARPEFFHKAPCFASSAMYELHSEGRKVVASAQKRQGDCLLQHGAIKLYGLASHPALDGREEDTSKPGWIDRVSFVELAAIFRQEMGLALGLEVAESALMGEERAYIEERREMIVRGPLERRELIKQTA